MRKQRFSPLQAIWLCNLFLFLTYATLGPSVSFLKSSVLEYNNVASDPFDGAVSPISYVPDWSKTENMNKARLFETFSTADFIEIPEYDEELLSDALQKTKSANILRYTYPVVYMGSYRGNHTEYDGSHGGVDIRAPIGTPIVSVANGVVVKVKNTESGDGKYVIIRHDNVDLDGSKETLYSGYLHLSEAIAVEGAKIGRGEVLGKVGMTGITTTPHLHFQIDKSTSPFHMYWPYSFKEAADLGLDFFGAINVGLGKENMIRYTIHPMDFIKNHPYLGSAPKEISQPIAVAETKKEAIIASSQIVADTTVPSNTIDTVVPKMDTVPVPETTIEPAKPTTVAEPVTTIATPPAFVSDSVHIFSDIPTTSTFYTATKYLRSAGVANGYEDGGFHPNSRLSRSEAILLYDRLFKDTNTDTEVDLPFIDILPSDELAQALTRAFQKKIVANGTYFRPNDSLTRAEAVTLLIRTSGIGLDTSRTSVFRDVKASNTHLAYINTFAKYLGIKSGNFEPNRDITRGELAKILYMFAQKRGK